MHDTVKASSLSPTLPIPSPQALGDAAAPSFDSTRKLIMGLRPLEWKDKEVFDNRLRTYPPETSEMTFTNFWAWKEIQYPQWSEVQGHLLVQIDSGDSPGCPLRFLPPIGPNPTAIMRSLLGEGSVVFERVGKGLADALSPNPQIVTEHTRDQDDYLLLRESVLLLRGGPSQSLRTALSHFERSFAVPPPPPVEVSAFRPCGSRIRVEELTTQNSSSAEQAIEGWLNSRQAQVDPTRFQGMVADAQACRRVLERIALTPSLRGIIVWVDQRPVATMIGEEIPATHGRTQTVIHFDKGIRSKELHGLNVFTIKEFARHLPGGSILNFEQDTGSPGLRREKSNFPRLQNADDGFVRKFRIRPRR